MNFFYSTLMYQLVVLYIHVFYSILTLHIYKCYQTSIRISRIIFPYEEIIETKNGMQLGCFSI